MKLCFLKFERKRKPKIFLQFNCKDQGKKSRNLIYVVAAISKIYPCRPTFCVFIFFIFHVGIILKNKIYQFTNADSLQCMYMVPYRHCTFSNYFFKQFLFAYLPVCCSVSMLHILSVYIHKHIF